MHNGPELAYIYKLMKWLLSKMILLAFRAFNNGVEELDIAARCRQSNMPHIIGNHSKKINKTH